MAFALVGTIGTAVQSTSGGNASPTFGASETRAFGNLLICFTSVTGTATLPATPSGWSIAKQLAGTSCSATIYYKSAAGSDAAPVITGVTSGLIAAQLAEFSGASGTPLDQTGSAAATSSPVTATFGGADKATTDLFVAASGDFRSVARTPTDTITSNHATITQAGSNNTVSSVNHYSFGYATSTSSIVGADTAIMTPSVTTSITGLVVAAATFKVPGANASSTVTGSLSFVGAIPKITNAIKSAAVSFAGRFTYPFRAAGTLSFSGAFTSAHLFFRTFTASLIHPIDSCSDVTNGNLNLDSLNNSSNPIKGGQSFTGDGTAITSVQFKVNKTGSPTGNAVVSIYAHSGTFGSTGIPTGSALATSDPIDASIFPTVGALVSFTFSSPIIAISGTHYFAILEYSGGDGSNLINLFYKTSGTHAGNLAYFYTSGGWQFLSTVDCAFVCQSLWPSILTKKTNKLITASLSFVGAIQKFLNISVANFTASLGFGTVPSTLLNGLQAYYKLEDVNDSGPNGITLTNNGSVTFGPGKVNNCATFSGSNFLDHALNDHFNAHLGSYTVAIWAKWTSTNTPMGFTSYGNWSGSPGGWEIRTTSNLPTCYFGGSVNHSVQDVTSRNDGNWHLIVARYDRTGNMSLFVDNVSVGTPVSITDVTEDLNATFYDLGVGFNAFSSDFTGSLDEAGYWNRALTGDNGAGNSATGEIALLWNGSAGTTYPFTVSGGGNVFLKQINRPITAALSFIGSLIRRTGYLITGTLSFRGNFIYPWRQSGTLSFVGSITRIPSRAFTATLSFAGSVTRLVLKTISAALSFIGNLTTALIHGGTLYTQAVSGTLSFVGALPRSISYLLTAAVSFIGAIPRQVLATRSGTLSFMGAATKRTAATKSGTLSFTGAILRYISRTISGAVSFIAALTRSVSYPLTASLSFSGSLLRSIARAVSGTLSFIGSITASHTVIKLLTGTLSFVGSITRSISYLMTAAVSFIGTLLRSITRNLSGTLSFVGSIIKSTSRTMTAVLSFIGSLLTGTLDHLTLTASLAFSGSMTKRTSHMMSGVLSFIGSLLRSIAHNLSGTLSFIGSITKSVLRTIAGTLSFVGILTTSAVEHLLLTAAISFSGAITKSTSHMMSGAVSFIGSITRFVAKLLSGTTSFVGSTLKNTQTTRSATLSFTGSLNNRISALKTATLSFIGSITKQTNKMLAASASFVGVIRKIPAKALSGTISFAGATTRFISYHLRSVLDFVGDFSRSSAGHFFTTLSASLDFVGSIRRSTSHHMSGSLTFIGAMAKRIPELLSAALSFSGSLIKSTRKTLAAILSFIGSLTPGNITYRELLTAVLNFTGSIRKQTYRTFSAILNSSGTTTKMVPVITSATLSFIGALSKPINKLFTAVVGFTGTIQKTIYRIVSATLSLIGSLVIFVPTRFMITLTATLNFASFLSARIPEVIKIAVDSVTQVIQISLNSTTQVIKVAVNSSIQIIKTAVTSTTQTIKIVVKAIVDSFNINP